MEHLGLFTGGTILVIGTGFAFFIGYLASRDEAAQDRKSTRLNSSHSQQSRMPSSA